MAESGPDFGPNVLIFDQSMTAILARIDAIFAGQERGQFNANRYALLFKPGKYELDVKVGFYTQVSGLGRSPDDVSITGAVRSKAGWMKNRNATCNFWRSAENLCITPTVEENVNVWAVSQATALRRVHVKGDLNLSDGGWSIRRVHRGLQDRWARELGVAAAVALSQRGVEELAGRELEHGLRGRIRSAGRRVARTAVHGD